MNQVVMNVKEMIRTKGLKQYHVAMAAGFDPRHFSCMLTGRKVMRAEYIMPIAKALGTDPNTIYGYHQNGTA